MNGVAVISVPFAAKWHCIPFDYWRFTPTGFKKLVDGNQYKYISFKEMYRRGSDVSVAFHMLTVSIVSVFFRPDIISKIIGLVLSPLAVFFGILANFAEWFDIGSPENTLGYVFVLEKNATE